jgi:mono/diheme cytochrome c family protein
VRWTPLPLPAALCWPLTLLIAQVCATAATAAPVDFARDIQPIFAAHCYDCHGVDKPKAGLQLTSLAHALKGGESGEPALIAGNSVKSLLIQRVTTDDDNDVMPQKAERLTRREIDLLTRWIDEGAPWPEDLKHWAYVKPVRPAIPEIRDRRAAIHNPIDSFILARLERERLAPSPPVDRPRWLRRVSLDLIGLPPSPQEVAAFLADPSEQAYERVVDRLLASPHYGERWARPWLDLARYADSHGFQRDDLRDIWPYRDWVIRAMNADMPFDQFTVWQIAGDLLPDTPNPEHPTQNPKLKAQAPKRRSQFDVAIATPNWLRSTSLDRRIATGFHRTAPLNVEAGTDQEEGRVNQVFDRVNTTATVWLGTTMECAQCHNHKYDPFTKEEYYQLFAFFNNTPQETEFSGPRAMASLRFAGPVLELPDPEVAARRSALESHLAELAVTLAAESERALAGLEEWEKTAAGSLASAAQTHPLEIADFESTGGSVYRILPDHSVLLVDEAPDRDAYILKVNTHLTGITGFKIEALTDPSLPGSGPGRSDAARPNFILNRVEVTATSNGAAPQPLRFVRATASYSQPRFSVETLLKPGANDRTGWAIGQQFHRDHWAILELPEPIGSAGGTTFTFTLVQNFGAGRTLGRVRVSALTGRATEKPLPAEIVATLQKPRTSRRAAEQTRLEEHYLSRHQQIDQLKLARAKATAELAALKGPQTLVMRELEQPRMTAVLNRGNFLEPGETVPPGTPAVLHALTAASPRSANELAAATRLDLARWLVDRENPLVARVTVNRWWAEFFGRGIVGTPEDFGIKGELPTHPELLDWLAVEFIERGWSMKHLHRLIALSATYRQSSRLTPELLARDDQNRLLARGPRFRLDAEAIRDNALAAAGLLSRKMGGPPVRPYQPPGLWENKVGGDRVTYEVSAGEDAWRRGIYTVWKRSSPYPSFVNFDATARTACTVQRSRSNTPLQALTLLNDPVYVEAALALARRVLHERPGATPGQRIRYAFQLCLAREPTSDEVAILQRLLEQQHSVYVADAAAAKALAGKPAPAANTTAAELAAWHAVATALLNLDEMITR